MTDVLEKIRSLGHPVTIHIDPNGFIFFETFEFSYHISSRVDFQFGLEQLYKHLIDIQILSDSDLHESK